VSDGLEDTLATYRDGSPSRSSTASFSPVDAPEGTDALAVMPLSSAMCTRTVGFPRESNISKAKSEAILLIEFS
jgi:hypothetical protein